MDPSKKKITQDELRRMMNEQKKKLLNNVKKIDSPLARYDKDGQLHCVLCETVVRSEAVWKVHINSKNHKHNIINKIKKKEESKANESVAPIKFKRPEIPAVAPPPKKIKGILKNSLTQEVPGKSMESNKNSIKSRLLCIEDEDEEIRGDSDNEIESKETPAVESSPDKESSVQEVLPEGFFDDPKLDAKVRNVEYKDPIEEEWELFQKEIKEETSKAQQIIAEDQEEATTERQIDEIDEQIRNWSRVVNLEKQKEKVNSAAIGQKMDSNIEDNSNDEEDFEEFLDWRSKKSFDWKFKKNLMRFRTKNSCDSSWEP